MEVKDKALLIKDLCGRLPYGVYVEHIRTGMRGHLHDLKVYPLYDKTDDHIYDYICSTDFLGDGDYFDIEAFKPLLFPLSSMTDEQKEEYHYIVNYISPDDTENWAEGEFIYVNQIEQLLHFYHTNHLDYRDLIAKDLAIDATNENIY
jgi:hypothetical protein